MFEKKLANLTSDEIVQLCTNALLDKHKLEISETSSYDFMQMST